MRRQSVQRDGPDPIDRHVGARLRSRRTSLALSQTALARAVGLTFQQIQKYERGSNRVSASALFRLSRALNISVAFFFDEMPPELTAGQCLPPARKVRSGDNQNRGNNVRMGRRTLGLARAYHRIRDERMRSQLFKIIEALGQNGGRADRDRSY
jgi:transcriptional regulator with XRE-family HTH domain